MGISIFLAVYVFISDENPNSHVMDDAPGAGKATLTCSTQRQQ